MKRFLILGICILFCGCFTTTTKMVISDNNGVININRNINANDSAMLPTEALQSPSGIPILPVSSGSVKNASGEEIKGNTK